MTDFMRDHGDDLAGMQTRLLGGAWEEAYAEAGRPTGFVGPEGGQRLMASFQDRLRTMMRDACGGVSAAELFFAGRLMMPHLLATIGWGSAENRPRLSPKFTMGLRRIATYGALDYGAPTPDTYSAPYGGAFGTRDAPRVAGAFAKLLLLSDGFAWAYLYQAMFGRGNEIAVDAEGPDLSRGDYARDALLVTSLDERKRLYYSPFSRVGEFSGEAASVLDPFEEGRRRVAGDWVLFLTSSYEALDDSGWAAYRLRGWPLDPLESFVEDLTPALAADAWGGTPEGVFMDLLGGLCLLVGEKLEDPEALLAAHEGSVVPLPASDVEGRPLIERSVEYSRRRGRSSDPDGLETHRQRFLGLLLSNGKAEAHDPFLRTSVGDTRYAYPLHRFGRTYSFDLYHADHWLHRLMDLLARGMRRGAEANAAGRRVEEQVWRFFEASEGIDTVGGLRGLVVEPRKGHDADDLDCPLQVGSTLILAEVKGERLHYETEAAERRFVRERWEGGGGRKGSREYLEKIDDTARKVAERRKEDEFRRPMTGVKRILPVLCRPYPEWIPDPNERHWLRPPSENDTGVPRVLTPAELRNFLLEASEESLDALPGGYVVDLDGGR